MRKKYRESSWLAFQNYLGEYLERFLRI